MFERRTHYVIKRDAIKKKNNLRDRIHGKKKK